MNKFMSALALALTGIACAQTISTPKAGSALRTQVLNGFRPTVEKTIGIPVVFKPFTFNVYGNWAFVIAQPLNKNGTSINYARTKLAKMRAQDGDIWSDTYEGLLHKVNGTWKVIHYKYDVSDFDGFELAKKYHLPNALFQAPKG